MAGKKLHCLFGIQDDLHEFAEAAINTLLLCAMNAPLTRCKDFGGVQAGILHRDKNFQIELIVVQPNVWIPEHVHPGTDTIEYPISGHVRFVINGKELFEGYDDDRFLSFSKGKGVRINQGDVHAGQTLPMGAMFLSIQRWDSKQPDHIGNNWLGAGVSETHHKIIEALR